MNEDLAVPWYPDTGVPRYDHIGALLFVGEHWVEDAKGQCGGIGSRLPESVTERVLWEQDE